MEHHEEPTSRAGEEPSETALRIYGAVIEAVEEAGFVIVTKERHEQLVNAVEFYANAQNWEAVKIGEVPAGEPNEGAQAWQSGPANDGGDHARKALNG